MAHRKPVAIPPKLQGAHARTKRGKYEILRNRLEIERNNFRPHWKDASNQILPRRGRFLISEANRNKGEQRNFNILDTTPSLAARTAAGGMMGGITSPARPWFRLSISGPRDVTDTVAVKIWLDKVVRDMREVFQKSNTYDILPLAYKDLVTFSQTCIMIEEDFDKTIRLTSFPIGSYMWANDQFGKVNTFMRDFRYTVQQIVDKFGRFGPKHDDVDWTNISQRVRDHWENGQFEEWIDVVHVIKPNEFHDPVRNESRFKKWSSDYYERGLSSQSGQSASNDNLDDMFLRESGFDIFPILGPRWEVTGEDVYGVDSPGMISIADCKQLQKHEQRGSQAVEKMVNPPLMGPSSLKKQKISLLSGDVTYYDTREGMQGLKPVHETRFPISDLELKSAQIRRRIDDAFFVPLFLMLQSDPRNRQITAREVEERHSEKILMMGPVLTRLNTELLQPLIDITFQIMFRQGKIDDPPVEIQGRPIKIEFVSIMAQAEKLSGLQSIERFLTDVGQMAQLQPDVLDKIDTDKAVDEIAETLGIPPEILVEQREVILIRQQRAEFQQQQAQMAQAAAEAKTAVDLSKADLNKDSALKRMLEATQAGELVRQSP